ncbi:spermidine synthase [Taibaiella koreensis]|uniref:spermidine synthase n=1 Tax=Taibaiella koreensis TaxID=1268548 RepID=UPI0013C35C22|nr:methyltransferase domain-containing protein [Taibaiella koreensis]
MHPFFKVSPVKRVLSYLIPVTIASTPGSKNKFLEFILYRNQWQLATEEALYSDGTRYQPFRIAFRNVPKDKLTALSHCLILGTGLGSIAQILKEKYKHNPRFTLVEYDEQILKWALENLSALGVHNLDPHCINAADFVKKDKGQYDLLCIDIFNGREVPSLFTEKEFLVQTRRLLKPGGIWIMNYIVNDEVELYQYLSNVKSIFSDVDVIEKEQNRILIVRG